MTRRRLRPWVKITLLLILGAIVGIAIYQLFTVEEINSTPVGTYKCRGGIIKIFTGSDEVAGYLGVGE